MCGIAGTIEPRRLDPLGAVRAMTEALRHRGPDDFALRSARLELGGEEYAAALGHARLAVLDLSSRGRQPMIRGELALVHNGEIYNFARLRTELEAAGERFETGTDTEVVLAAYRQWGAAAIGRLEGMFAFALWDGASESLLLARDRLGIKPLFYHPTGAGLLFASELGALRAHPRFEAAIDRAALGRFLRFGSVAAPETIYRDTFKLLPGQTLVWRRGEWRTERYWDLGGEVEAPPDDPASAVDALEELLRRSVRDRLVADVPRGAFLSGGIDSSTVVALMQELSDEPVRTFSIGFEEPDFDESAPARAVARHLGTRHTDLIVDRAAARRVVRELPALYDEPFGDASALPTILVSRLARRDVTVALTGDGGDELFGGYSRYRRIAQLSRLFALPRPVRHLIRVVASAAPPAAWRRAASRLSAPDLARAAEAFTARFPAADTERLCGPGAGAPRRRYLEIFEQAAGAPAVRRAMLADLGTYLADDILTKVDRASMSVGLEARVPLLDHRLVRFAAGLPADWLSRDGETKGPLRQLAYRKVPRSLLDRPKRGFGFPVARMLGTELGEWRRRYLDPGRLAAEGNIDPEALPGVEALLAAADRTGGKALWHLLCFQRWFAHHHGAGLEDGEPCA